MNTIGERDCESAYISLLGLAYSISSIIILLYKVRIWSFGLRARSGRVFVGKAQPGPWQALGGGFGL